MFPERWRVMRKLILCVLLLSVLCSCSAAPVRREFFAMDTVVTLEAYGGSAALDAAQAEILRLEQLFSIGEPQSDAARLNARGTHTLSPETAALLTAAREISAASGGALDVTIGPVVRLWDWYDGAPAVPEAAELAAALALVDFESLRLDGREATLEKPGMAVDLGGIAKGFAAGSAAKVLRDQGVTSALLNLGGNIRAVGAKPDGSPWIVGIADPDDPAGYCCTVEAADCAVVTSGDYQRYFIQDGQTYHHIFDPETGFPVETSLRSVTVLCKDDTWADGLSTALFVLGMEDGAALWRSCPVDFEAVFLTDDGISITEGLVGQFHCQEGYEVIAQ